MFQVRLLFFLLIISPGFLSGADLQIVNLRVEYAEAPVGIDVERPRFSWQMSVTGNQRGYKQTAYQLVVTDESGKPAWNSGKVKSDASLNIEYNGIPLRAATRYSWVIDVWDHKGQMTFARGNYESLYGRIESSWERKGSYYHYRFVVPANTTATVYIPAKNEKQVTESGKPAVKAPGIRFLQMNHGRASYEAGPGTYTFISAR